MARSRQPRSPVRTTSIQARHDRLARSRNESPQAVTPLVLLRPLQRVTRGQTAKLPVNHSSSGCKADDREARSRWVAFWPPPQAYAEHLHLWRHMSHAPPANCGHGAVGFRPKPLEASCGRACLRCSLLPVASDLRAEAAHDLTSAVAIDKRCSIAVYLSVAMFGLLWRTSLPTRVLAGWSGR